MKRLVTFILFSTLLSCSAALSEITCQNLRLYDDDKEKVVAGRGVIYMQPNAMHHHFWDNFEVRRLEADLDLYKERGFDTIVLKPGWGDFVPEIWHFDTQNVTPIYDQNAFNLLDLIIDEAAERDIYVLVMTGIMTTPKFYTNAGTTLSTRIGSANYEVYYTASSTWALYSDTNTNTLWNNFQATIASALQDKDNVLGYVIEPETTGYPCREMTTTEVAGWNNAIKNADPNALTGYTPITKNSTTCNMANTDVIFVNSYPGEDEFSDASNLSYQINSIRTYNSTKPVFFRETGISTYDYTQSDQSAYLRATRNVCEEGVERISGYCFWMSQDFNPSIFHIPGMSTDWDNSQASFGLWDINSQAKAAINMWVKLPVVNPSFETLGNGGAPDGWDTAWTYGDPSNWYVQRSASSPYSGSYCLRMYTGTNASNAIIFSLSDKMQCTPNTPLTVRAKMRYALTSGTAYLTVFEYDENDNYIQSKETTFTGGNWTWKQNEINFITSPDTCYLYIRWGVGGESGEYLDVDLEEDLLSSRTPNSSFETDTDSDGKPDGWENSWVWNGSRTGWSANITYLPTLVVNGTHCLRVYTGSGDTNAHIMVDSDYFQARPLTSYNIPVYARYGGNPGDTMVYWVLEFDSNYNYLAAHSLICYPSTWEFSKRTLSFTSHSSVKYFLIRFDVAGTGVYCDIDWILDYPY
ncbi:MAG: hypothetical protein A2Y12_05610 [Planctomycetes bacterium GWF2_42_9]|nr:MAG: hypothetical protein A2Y12_05610 [Planctomycetes bacterium GWF2_42_9]